MAGMIEKTKGLACLAMSSVGELILAPISLIKSGSGVVLITTAAGTLGLAYLFKNRIKMIGKDEQLFLETATELKIVNGPRIYALPIVYKTAEIEKAVTLTAVQYCIVVNELTGVKRIEKGPQLLYLKAYDKILEGAKHEVISLTKNEYIRLKDHATGKIRVILGEKANIIPEPTEKLYDGRKMNSIDLKSNQYCVISDRETGQLRTERGEKLIYLGAFEEMHKNPTTAIILKKNEYCTIENSKTGEKRVERGEQLIFPEPYETIIGNRKHAAIDLRSFEYSKIIDKRTGKLRTERGEKLVFPGAFDEIVEKSTGKYEATAIDEDTAVIVRNTRDGQQRLVTEKQRFVPDDDEEIVEVTKLTKLADYEACIVRGKDGQDQFYYGKNENQRTFFTPPYSEIVQLCWSRGRRRERRDLYISKIDLRPQFMSFEFNCRTSDNVELILEGTLFWEIVDPEKMFKLTGNTTGDVCSHARSEFIQSVSKVSLQGFMQDFNQIAASAHREEDDFYSKRGCKIHSLEVTGYNCADSTTSKVLGQIIQETTNRMNRLQCQESESEVKLQKIKGQIEEENARKHLLTIQTENSNQEAACLGLSEAEKVKRFLEELEAKVPNLETRIGLWKTLRKTDALAVVGDKNSRLFFTPNDVNLSIKSED